IGIALPDALRSVPGSEIPRVSFVDAGIARLAILKVKRIRNTFHKGAQQPTLLIHYLDALEVNRSSGDLRLNLKRFPRGRDIGEDLSAIDRLREGADIGISGHHDAGGSRDIFHTAQKFVATDPGDALIA